MKKLYDNSTTAAYPNTKIFLGATSHVRTAIVGYCKPHYLLESYIDLRKKTKATKQYIDWCVGYSDDLMIDSGAFSFLSNPNKYKDVSLSDYLDSYISFINEYDINKFMELDIDSIIGYDEVVRLRDVLEKQTGKKSIPVWHRSRGINEYKKLISEYEFVAIGGIVIKEILPSEYDMLYDLCRLAHDAGCKVHGLGFTRLQYFDNHTCPFDSVDSTSWQGHRYGEYCVLNDNKITKIKSGDNWKSLDRISFDTWTKYSMIYEGAIEGIKDIDKEVGGTKIMLDNSQGITNIKMMPSAVCKCAIGQDWYTNRFTVTFVPSNSYPDYMDVEKWLDENIRGKEYNIEDAVDNFGKYLVENYSPRHLLVESSVDDASTHFPVVVSKTYY